MQLGAGPFQEGTETITEEGQCTSCDGTGRLLGVYYDRIDIRSVRQKSEFRQRNQMCLGANKAFLQTGLRTAHIFVNEVGTVATHCAGAEFDVLLGVTAAYIDTEATGAEAAVDITNVMEVLDGARGSGTLEVLGSLTEAAKAPRDQINRAKSAFESALLFGKRYVGDKALESLARDLVESFTVGLEGQSSLVACDGNDDEEEDKSGGDEAHQDSSSGTSPSEMVVSSPHDALGAAVRTLGSDALTSIEVFIQAWRAQVLDLSAEETAHLLKIKQGTVDPSSGLDVKNPDHSVIRDNHC